MLNGCSCDFAGTDALQRAVFDAAPDRGSAYAENSSCAIDADERRQCGDGIVGISGAAGNTGTKARHDADP